MQDYIKPNDPNYEDLLKASETLKEEGNEYMKKEKFIEALSKFTEAIDKKVETPKNAIYYSNRALANINLENYGLAIEGNLF